MHHITQDITNKWVNFLFPIPIHLVIAWNDVNPSKNAWYSLRKMSDATFPPHITSKFERVRQNNRSITCADVQPKHSNLNLNPFCRSCVITCGLKMCKLFDARHRVKKQFQTYYNSSWWLSNSMHFIVQTWTLQESTNWRSRNNIRLVTHLPLTRK